MTARTLGIVWVVPCLIGGSEQTYSDESDRIV